MEAARNNIVRLDYERHDLFIHIDSHIEIESRAFSCQKEPDTVAWIDKYFKEGDRALDIGANIGAYTLIMSRNVGDRGMIYAFEPGWHNFYQLNRNIILNKCESNTMALNIALTSDKKINVFNYRDFIFGSSLHTLGKAVDFVGNEFKPYACQQILSYTVDAFIEEFNLRPINHIKLDVDGIEAEVIKGAQRTLKTPPCISMMVELNEAFESDRECIEFLHQIGFKTVSRRPNPSAFYQSETIYNYIFAKI
ncbi:MAG: FkbM family methyltransferase [Deltaproteobacteria bacterium]|nr:MAG: FkbM family methyltransferase [Deltaproteobacteria bacterium]